MEEAAILSKYPVAGLWVASGNGLYCRGMTLMRVLLAFLDLHCWSLFDSTTLVRNITHFLDSDVVRRLACAGQI